MEQTPQSSRRTWRNFFVLLVGLSLTSCAGVLTGPEDGGSSGVGGGGGAGGNGTLVLFAEDQPAGNVLAFELTINSVTLTGSGATPVSVLPSSEAVPLEWRSRGLAPTVIKVASIPADTYTQLTVSFISPAQLIVFDPVTSSFNSVSTPLNPLTPVNVPINLSVGSGEVVGLRLDFDLRNAIQLDAMNNLFVAPMVAVIPTSFVPGQLPGDIDDVLGTVNAVNVSGGRFDFTVLSSNEALTVTTDANTLFEVVGGLGSLQMNDRVELDARLQASGNFLAQEVERETTNSEQQVRGLVLARTPAVGTLTSLNLLVLDAVPSSFAAGTACPTTGGVPAGALCTIAVDATTSFRISTEDLPVALFPNLDFDRDSLGAGQFVHIVRRAGTGFVADSITLEEITIVGQVGAGAGTTIFDLLPDGDFFLLNGLGLISVVTTTVTELEDMPAGLGSLQPNQSIVGVRGVLVFQGGNGVLMAKRVRLLQP